MTKIGKPTDKKIRGGTWVQTERAAHEAWARLAVDSPRASALLHIMIARMNDQNALVISQKLLAKMMGSSLSTTKRSITELVGGSWIQQVKIGQGSASAYVVNSRVAWAKSRKDISCAIFSATVIADMDDQNQMGLGHGALRAIPVLYENERQSPTGQGQEPPSQPALDGLEPDLPTRSGSNPRDNQGEKSQPRIQSGSIFDEDGGYLEDDE